MDSSLETRILKLLALGALIIAAVIGIFIVSDSGIINGSDSSGSESSVVSPETVSETVSQAATEEEASGDEATQETVTVDETQTTAFKEYTVKEGDSFATIAAENSTTIADIQELNPEVNSNNMHVGDILKLPAASR